MRWYGEDKPAAETVSEALEFWRSQARRCAWAMEDMRTFPSAAVSDAVRQYFVDGARLSAEGVAQAEAAAAVLEAPTADNRAALARFDVELGHSQVLTPQGDELAAAVLYRLGRFREQQAEDFLNAGVRMDRELRAAVTAVRVAEREGGVAAPEVAAEMERGATERAGHRQDAIEVDAVARMQRSAQAAGEQQQAQLAAAQADKATAAFAEMLASAPAQPAAPSTRPRQAGRDSVKPAAKEQASGRDDGGNEA